MTNAVILISGSGSNLQSFIDQVAAGILPINIALVISNKADAFGLQRAQQANIPTQVISHRDFETRLDFDRALMTAIDAAQPEVVILAGFMRILTEEFVNHYPGKLLNIHPSLLPKYPGTNTHQRVLDAGDKWHGSTIHFVVPQVDAGPIILQGRLRVRQGEDASALQQRVLKIEHKLYPQAVKWFAERRLKIENGNVLLDDEISALQLQDFEL